MLDLAPVLLALLLAPLVHAWERSREPRGER